MKNHNNQIDLTLLQTLLWSKILTLNLKTMQYYVLDGVSVSQENILAVQQGQVFSFLEDKMNPIRVVKKCQKKVKTRKNIWNILRQNNILTIIKLTFGILRNM